MSFFRKIPTRKIPRVFLTGRSILNQNYRMSQMTKHFRLSFSFYLCFSISFIPCSTSNIIFALLVLSRQTSCSACSLTLLARLISLYVCSATVTTSAPILLNPRPVYVIHFYFCVCVPPLVLVRACHRSKVPIEQPLWTSVPNRSTTRGALIYALIPKR